jgi:hypothetical protein
MNACVAICPATKSASCHGTDGPSANYAPKSQFNEQKRGEPWPDVKPAATTTFQVSMSGTTRTFDSFECAIHALAPTCCNCGIRIVGHGLEKDGVFFCCEHCAEVVGVRGLRDRIAAA